mmetsp:Transcript_20693/g.44939  ORF Transcript_20693/g.44939 Transcript_20693/m.44939 type:complete len:178 (-) Transcript_20693:139-672(-)
MCEPNGGLEGTVKARRLENEDRKWERKLKQWNTKKMEEQKAQEEEEAKKRKREEEEAEAERAAKARFVPTGDALFDPKAYFAEWQAQALGSAGKGRGKGNSKGKVNSKDAYVQRCMKRALNNAGLNQPIEYVAGASSPPPSSPASGKGQAKGRAEVAAKDDGPVLSGLGALAGYDSD